MLLKDNFLLYLIIANFLGVSQSIWDYEKQGGHVLGSNDIDSTIEYYNSENVSGEKENNVPEKFSTPEECARACSEDEKPRYCYYHFTMEYYVTMSGACELCKPNSTDNTANVPQCQCVEADGFERGILSINRMLPGPSIQVCLNDVIIVDVQNNIEGMEVALHWHGLWQQDYQYYDGVPFLTQCPIPSGTTFRYQFVASNPGTHFYHSHAGMQKIDGQYGSLIVREPPNSDPHTRLYDMDLVDHVILISDWMHEISTERYPGRIKNNPGQIPENVLINGKGRWTDPTTGKTTSVQLETFYIRWGRRYRFRLINSFSSVCPASFTIQGHVLRLIAQDGEPVEPHDVDTIITSSGERVDFIINAQQPVQAYWIQVRAIGECERFKPNQFAILRYYGGPEVPAAPQPGWEVDLRRVVVYNPLDGKCDQPRPDAVCANQLRASRRPSPVLLKAQPDHRIILPYRFFTYINSFEELFKPGSYKRYLVAADTDHITSIVDGISFVFPKVPPLSQPVTIDDTCDRNRLPKNCETPCECPHTHHIKKGAVVEVVVYDEVSQPMLAHPFHLHGYTFQILKIGSFADKRNISQNDILSVLHEHQKVMDSGTNRLPPGKDTVSVPEAGYIIFRFKADNPGWWLFHCHFLYHVSIGMNAIFHVGEKEDLPPVPPMFPKCNSYKPKVEPAVYNAPYYN